MHKFIKSVPQALFSKIIYQSALGYIKVERPTGTLRNTPKEVTNGWKQEALPRPK